MTVTMELPDAFWFQEGPGVRNWQFTNTGIKLLNVANITKHGEIDLNKTTRCLSEAEVRSKYTHFLVDAGDLVVASSGISFEEDGLLRTRGAFVDERHLPLCMNTSTIRFKSKEGLSDLNYLKFWLDSDEFRGQITRLVTGSAQQNFGPSHLKSIHITLPPLEKQRCIARWLDKADRLRRARRYVREIGERFLPSVFLEMFGDPVKNPHGWEVATVRDVADIIVPTRDKPKRFCGDIPWITLPDVNGLFVSTARQTLSHEDAAEVSNRLMPPNTVLLSCAGSLGRIAVTTREVYANQQFYGLVCKGIEFLFLAMYLWSLGERFYYNLAGISTIGFFSKDKALDVRVLVPPSELQEKFAAIVQSTERLRAQQREADRQAEHLFASLLDRAFSG